MQTGPYNERPGLAAADSVERSQTDPKGGPVPGRKTHAAVLTGELQALGETWVTPFSGKQSRHGRCGMKPRAARLTTGRGQRLGGNPRPWRPPCAGELLPGAERSGNRVEERADDAHDFGQRVGRVE